MANGRGDGTGGTGGEVSDTAARALLALVPPLRFALAGDARASRLAGFGTTVHGAVARARAAGVPDSPALARLEAEAERFDALPGKERPKTLARIAAHLSALIPLPPELRDVARVARVEMLSASTSAHPERSAAAGGAESKGTPTAAMPALLPAAPEPEWHESPPRAPRPSAPSVAGGSRRPSPRSPAPTRRRAACSRSAGGATVEQALEFWPRAYQDRTTLRRVAELRPGDEGIVLATVAHVPHPADAQRTSRCSR